MPTIAVNGINLHFDEYGSGELVILITGSGGAGRLWRPCQVPALTAAGYRVITVDNRGIPPTDRCPEGFTLSDMVGDIAGLIMALDAGSCRVVGFSLGGIVLQELLLAQPGLVTQAVLIATRGRTDALRYAMSEAEGALLSSEIVLPPKYSAFVQVMQSLSHRTQNDELQIRDWLDVFEMSILDPAIRRAHHGLDIIDNRLGEYRKIKSPCLVIGFQDDQICPPQFCREVAGCIPDCRYEEVAGCGHYGYLEDPEAVNSSIIKFFSSSVYSEAS